MRTSFENAGLHTLRRRGAIAAASGLASLVALTGCGSHEAPIMSEAQGVATTVGAPRPAGLETTTTLAPTTTEAPTTLATTTTTTTPKANNVPKITVNNFEGLTPGMGFNEISNQHYDLKRSCGANYEVSGAPTQLTVRMVDSALDSIASRSPEVSTLSGIHVGSSKSDVLNAYGKNVISKHVPGNAGSYEVLVFTSPDSIRENTELLFSLGAQGTVDQIDLTALSNGTPQPIGC